MVNNYMLCDIVVCVVACVWLSRGCVVFCFLGLGCEYFFVYWNTISRIHYSNECNFGTISSGRTRRGSGGGRHGHGVGGLHFAAHCLTQIRQMCRKYAEKFIDIQRAEFKRLGVMGEWDNAYLTMSYDYEATIVGEC